MAKKASENQDDTQDKITQDTDTTDVEKDRLSAELQKSQEARIRAEAERDATTKAMEVLKTLQQNPQAQTQITDEQWQQITEKTGMSKEAYIMNAQVTQQMVETAKQSFAAELRVAKEAAAAAEQKATLSEKRREVDQIKGSFYASKPGLAKYKKDIEDFLGKFPETDRTDAAKLPGYLDMAEMYLKGKIGDTMRKDTTGSTRFERGEEIESTEETIDTAGFKPIEGQFISFAQSAVARKKDIDDNPATIGEGVALSGVKEWADAAKAYREQFKK